MRDKKNLSIVAPETETIEQNISKPLAKQTHRIVTTYEKAVPIDEAEMSESIEEEDEEDTPIEIPAVVEPPFESGYSDSITQMLSDLQITQRQHSWTMVVERLPLFEKDNRHDVQSKRINCGTRPMSVEFIEDIRREFARPNKANHFRVTIKRDGKIYAHWPEVISLEPPPLDEIADYEQRTNAVMPSINISTPNQQPSFKTMIEQFKQLAELREVLFPGQSQGNPQKDVPLTEEAALLKLLSSNDDVIDRLSKQISKKLFRDDSSSSDLGWMDVFKSALDNGPGIVRELFAGMAKIKIEQSPSVMAPPIMQVSPSALAPDAPPASVPAQSFSPNPPEMVAPPEAVLLSNVIRFCELKYPPDAAAAFVDAFTNQNPQVEPMLEMFLTMSPEACKQFIVASVPQAASIANAPHAHQWIADLQAALTKPEETE